MKRRPLLTYLFLFTLFVGIDFLVKEWTLANITPMALSQTQFPYGGLAVFHDFFGIDFSINLVFNKGMAWGLFSQYPQILLIFRLILIGALLLNLFVFGERGKGDLPLIFILSGASGNVIDTFLRGHVIDMFYFNFWGKAPFAVFNVSDFLICLGIVWITLQYLTRPKIYASAT